MTGWLLVGLVLIVALLLFGATLGLLLGDAGERQDEAERRSGRLE